MWAALFATLGHTLWFLAETGQWALLISVVAALVGGETANLVWKGKTMSAEFLEKWSKSGKKTTLATLLMILLNLFGLHLQGWM